MAPWRPHPGVIDGAIATPYIPCVRTKPNAAFRRIASHLDPGIAVIVELLLAAGVETFESCEGGPGHAFPEPTVRFYGHRDEGYRALAVVLQAGIRVSALRRYWSVIDGEPTGPHWELVFAGATPAPTDPSNRLG